MSSEAAGGGAAVRRRPQQQRAEPSGSPQPPPPQPPPPSAGTATLRGIESAASVLSTIVQILVYRRTYATVTPREHAHQVILVALHLTSTAVICFLPHRAWLRYRILAVACCRALIIFVPSYRSITEGAATLLHRPATPGLRGLILDYLLVAMGTRQLLSSVFSGLLHHPPLAVAAQQIVHVLLTGSAKDYCRTELLAHPISQQRFAAIAGALELWSAFPLPGGTFLARGAGGLRDAHRECTAVLHLHQIGCILVPTLVAALLVRRSPWAVERSADVAEEQQTGWQRACAALQRRLAWAGEELQATIAGAHPLQQALIWWLALGSLWTLAQVIDS